MACKALTCKPIEEDDKKYCETYDAYYNPITDEWLEKKCSDPECDYCKNRPDKPSEVK